MVLHLSILFLFLFSSKIVVNFLRNPNPKEEFELTFNEKDELTGVRFFATKIAKSMSMIITCVTIMAIDYPSIFPRKLSKTEDSGYSFMDSGVALVMIFSGMTNPLVVKQDCKNPIPPFFKGLMKAIASNKLVTFAASLRFFLLHSINYHDHVTEWGVHWNFFVTIAFLNVMTVFIRSSKHVLLIAISTIFVSEFIQAHWDLKTYIYNAPRIDFITANKEGFISIAGYFSI